MAELVGGALLSAFLEPLVQKLASEVKDFFKGKDAILKLLKELKTLLSTADLLLTDAEEKLIKDQAVRKWLDDLKDTVYDADDLVYKIDTEAWQNKLEGHESRTRSSYGCCNKVLIRFNPTPFTAFDKGIKREIEGTLDRLKHLLENKDLGLERLKKHKLPERVCAPLLQESDVYGRDVEKEAIIKLLLSDETTESGDKLYVIPVVGMGGIGKTTLAQLVYNDERVNQKFDTKIWITVGDDKLDCMKMMKLIVEKVTFEKCEIEEPYDLQDKLKRALSTKKFLFVVDDVWDEDPTKWGVLKNSFESGLLGSKIIVTTRSTIVASIMKTESIYQLKRISDVDGWLLFAKHASINASSNEYSDLQEIGKKIVDKCKGLPLAIKSIGDLLRGKRSNEEWNSILNNDIWELYERKNVSILPALWLSYFYLPSRLKQCFAYCALFPKDYGFIKDDVILLWMAEGLVHSQNKKRMEETGEEYFQDLISRSFFQPSNENKSTFLMHDLIHDLAMFVSGEFCSLINGNKCSNKVRHMLYMKDCKKDYHLKAKGLRTLLWHPELELDRESLSKVKHLHSSFPHLRVLSIRNDTLPNSIGNLKYLRYLKLQCYYIDRIPNSICNLYNLEILLLEGCKNVTLLPYDIGNLVKLRHLSVPLELEEMPLQFGKLQNLQTLNRFIVGKKKDVGIKLLKELQDLHGSLSIWGLENVRSIEDVPDGILQNQKFLKLSLDWDYGHEPDDLHREKGILDTLKPHPNLKELKIENYKGSSFPIWIGHHLFSDLVRVELKSCHNCSSLPSLGQLPSLKDLVISGMNGVVSIGSEFHYLTTSVDPFAATETNPFRCLRSLRFEDMKELQEWSFNECGVFPHLSELHFVQCRRLKVLLLPDYFPSLRELKINQCEQLMPLLPRAQPTSPAPPFPSLEILEIFDCNGQESLLEEGLPLSLKSIVIMGCMNLKCLDDSAFRRLTCLEKLEIEYCRKLRCLPKELPTSLSYLRIYYCELLTPRIERETGEDWSIIAHIPNVSSRDYRWENLQL
ncbi:putative disease resistance RPP13-like protein 1 [Humulus lupulus]|uniref:putative disease resistance RPP13-like protein 1 n=1 Tax=Humulus lupulus TaxID=3486 RepID=UPI002B40D73F|nr:putative disease resistance RPP13-like protein 1 [Humulus lupulus]XP_062115533.1 putative disease resistance RPP13-like protein 1 [Humulus lupulus]XP_062115534.1 putative disease resistance RPP13-like protein 1 [Humulus lupulus]XP_062115535.1 putative disease resistance RPP13-like protein 1 [Humulus lupulus]